MFRNLIPMLADKYHVVAPDFPGYGESSALSVDDFDYSFERLASVTEKFTEKLNLSSYALYLSDIGASIGFRLAVMHPERVTAMIIQNGEAHVEALNKEFLTGLFDYWEDRSEKNTQVLLDWLLTIEGTKWHYLHGASDPSKIGEILDLLENETGMHSCLASKPKIAGWRRRQEEASPWSREYRPRSEQARSSRSC
jgi:pimeloyl-ACP methyl ester carboxylesterase